MKRDIHIFWTLALFFFSFLKVRDDDFVVVALSHLAEVEDSFHLVVVVHPISYDEISPIQHSALSAASTSFLLKIYLFWYVSCTF